MTQRCSARRGFIAAAVAALAAVLLLSAAGATAGLGLPPKTVLRVGGLIQHGGLVWEEWTSADGRYCVANSGDGTGAYPKPMHLSPGQHSARLVLMRRQRPTEVTITAWHELDSNGQQIGPSEMLPSTLHPRRDADGERVGWAALFSVDVPPGYYIRLYVRWPNGKCGGPRHVLRTYALGSIG